MLCEDRKKISFRGIVAEVLAFCVKFESCSFSWVRRIANKIVHELSQCAYSCDRVYYSPVISEVIMYSLESNFSDL